MGFLVSTKERTYHETICDGTATEEAFFLSLYNGPAFPEISSKSYRTELSRISAFSISQTITIEIGMTFRPLALLLENMVLPVFVSNHWSKGVTWSSMLEIISG